MDDLKLERVFKCHKIRIRIVRLKLRKTVLTQSVAKGTAVFFIFYNVIYINS